jgi:hypothetical protein
MGADYSSYAVIGVEINSDGLYTVTETPATGEKSFNPDTGERLMHKERTPIEGFERGVVSGDDSFKDFPVFWTTDSESCVIGIGVGGTYSNGGEDVCMMSIDDVNIEALKQELKEVLEPIGLWDESKFGLYTILHCSY